VEISNTAKVFLIIVTLECLDVLGLTIEKISTSPSFDPHVQISVLLCIGSLFLVYFAINGVLTENKFELLSFIAVTLLVSFYAIYSYLTQPSTSVESQLVSFIRFLSLCLFCPLNFILGWFTYKSFGWKVYRKIGANIDLQRKQNIPNFYFCN